MSDETKTPTQSDDTAPQAPTELQVLKDRARLMGITFSNNIGIDSLRAKIEAKLAGEQEAADADADDDADATANLLTDPETGSVPTPALGLDAEPVAEVAAEVAEAPAPTPAPVAPVVEETVIVQPETTVPAAEVVPPPAAPTPPAAPAPARKLTALEERNKFRQDLINEQMRLVRLRITNLNPSKKELPGEIFTVANEFIGTIRKFIPYGEVTDNGFHVPYCIYLQLEERRFVNIRTRKDPRTGQLRVENNLTKEFALEILPQLTPEELARLAAQQAASGSTSEDSLV